MQLRYRSKRRRLAGWYAARGEFFSGQIATEYSNKNEISLQAHVNVVPQTSEVLSLFDSFILELK